MLVWCLQYLFFENPINGDMGYLLDVPLFIHGYTSYKRPQPAQTYHKDPL